MQIPAAAAAAKRTSLANAEMIERIWAHRKQILKVAEMVTSTSRRRRGSHLCARLDADSTAV